MDFWKKAAAAALALVLSLSAFPVTAFAAANKGDTLMWVDDMTTHGFYYRRATLTRRKAISARRRC